jgi:hypothetical protein
LKVSAPTTPTAPTIVAVPSTQSELVNGNGQANGKEKKTKPEPVPAPSPPPAAPVLSGGLSMAAVWESQADRRADERAAADEAKVKARTAPPPQVATDGSVEALSQMQSAIENAEANRVAAEKAAEAKLAEAERDQPRFPAQTEERSDRFNAEPDAVSREAKPSISFQAYQSSYKPAEDNGSMFDGRA